MSGFGAVRTSTGGMLRHKVQALVIGGVLLVSTASATLGLALLSASNAPFQHAFAAQRGADATLTLTRQPSSAQLKAAQSLRGVTASSGPFGEVTVQTEEGGQPWGQLTLAGRPAASGSVDDLVLTAGHWVTGPGQIVLSGTPADQGLQTGARLVVTGVPGKPALTVVGFANSVTDSADG
jgi:putative ABC transport system permease protein